MRTVQEIMRTGQMERSGGSRALPENIGKGIPDKDAGIIVKKLSTCKGNCSSGHWQGWRLLTTI